MKCLIHYFGLKSYSKLKPVSSVNEEAILKAKSICESIGGQNHHQQQCNSIPASIDKEKHQLHCECFTLVNSKNPVEKSETRKSSRSSAGGLSKLKDSLFLLLEE